MSGSKIVAGLKEALEHARGERLLVGFVDGKWFAMKASEALAGPFESNAEAWGWIDRRDQEELEEIDRRNRIRTAFSGE